MLTFTKHLRPNPDAIVSFTLPMTADDRTRSRHRFETETGEKLHLSLPRGTVLRDRDLLQSEDGSCLVLVSAKPESVLTARASTADFKRVAPFSRLLYTVFLPIYHSF